MFDDLVREQLRVLGTSTLHEAQGRRGALPSTIRPVWKGAFLAGPAFTVQVKPGDNLAIHHAVALAAPGDILIVDSGGFPESGVWGEVLTIAARHKGIQGLVVNGSVRDIDRLEALNFPIFCRGVSMGGTTKDDPGILGGPILFGEAEINQGDILVADTDGVLVIKQAELKTVLLAAKDREEKEKEIMKSLTAGKLTIELLGLKAIETKEAVQ
jgi:4-hydroxy-4-methyl-2-oxoglutarate aldolase